MSQGEIRRLAAIMFTDIVGFSRQMGADESRTLRLLALHNQIIQQAATAHNGAVIKTVGDAFLVDFPSVVNAVQCAQQVHAQLRAYNTGKENTEQIHVRIGIHSGDIVQQGGDVFGNGVNVASRLQGLAEPDTICISHIVYQEVENKLTLGAVAGGLLAGRYFWRSPLSTQDSALRTAAAPAALPLPDKPSIVVLPFDNMSKDPEQDYFSNGITEVLTSDLSRISSLFVIARNTAFTYKGKATNVQEIGKELGVRYVLEGSVQRAGDQVRIVVQLVDTTTDTHLWSERFDRPFQDIFALQDEIVQKIVTTLKLQLTVQGEWYGTRKHTDNLEAYDSLLRGLEPFFRYTKETNAQARQLFEKAIALDPQYAEAYAYLGWTYHREWFFRWTADPQTLERAFELAQQAVALDDSLPVAHSVLCQVYGQQQQYDQALAEGERAIALDPNNADSYARKGAGLLFAGRPEEVLPLMEQAMRLNPRYPPNYLLQLGVTYLLTGRYAEAITMLQEASNRNPSDFLAALLLSRSYVWQWADQQGSGFQTLAQAVTAAQRAISLNGSHPLGPVFSGDVYLWQKQYEQAMAEMERAVALDPNDAFGSAALAETLSRVGRADEALRAAERAQALHQKTGTADQHLDSVGIAYDLAGKPEEAIAPLRQYLSHYPNILGAHLTLAAVYSELGKEVEARAEAAEVLRINPQFSLEVHKERVPIKDPAMLERHIAALRKAGLK
ncbi:MAG: tetratricopeptide repeat protein [Deltaproteobacteria bacterium]|nr:tetratricopeptide repeat protein [Deltaproteobacteria bacterium]